MNISLMQASAQALETETGFTSRAAVVEFAPKSKSFPKVGDTLTIKHQVKRTNAGDALGLQRADGKGSTAKITAVFMDGQVRTGHSDVWEVKPGTQGHWETINPMHVGK